MYMEAVIVPVYFMCDVCFFASSWFAKDNFLPWNENYVEKDRGTEIAVFIEIVMLCRQSEPFCQISP